MTGTTTNFNTSIGIIYKIKYLGSTVEFTDNQSTGINFSYNIYSDTYYPYVELNGVYTVELTTTGIFCSNS